MQDTIHELMIKHEMTVQHQLGSTPGSKTLAMETTQLGKGNDKNPM